MRPPAVILQHGPLGPPGLLGDWARERRVPVQVHRCDLGDPFPKLDGQPFIASLGSRHSPVDIDVPEVTAELELIDRAVQRGIPVLGLCYGAQVLASVLGGEVEPAPEPELGWHRVSTEAPDVIAQGPWLQWHFDRFTLPPGAERLAFSPAGLQAFALGPHLGVQFHPESTIEIVGEWARADAERLRARGVAHPEALLENGRPPAHAAARAAFRLFNAFWRRINR